MGALPHPARDAQDLRGGLAVQLLKRTWPHPQIAEPKAPNVAAFACFVDHLRARLDPAPTPDMRPAL
jgi:hypothetical protein